MKADYMDIRSKVAGDPTWWDENGVPRYCPFGPHHVADIYCDEAALVEVACQSCGHRFCVALTRGRRHNLADQIRLRQAEYGDPPNTGCCAAGATMNSVALRVLEYWCRDVQHQWVRDPALEASDIKPEWAEDWEVHA